MKICICRVVAFKNDIIAELFDLEIDRHDNCGWHVSGAVSVLDVKRIEAPERIPVDAMDLTTLVSTFPQSSILPNIS